MKIPTRRLIWFAFLLALIPQSALAGNGNNDPFLALNTLWVLMAAFLVFFMQAGFGMVEVGLIRAKNACNILMKNLLDYCMASLAYFFFGYAIMFGGSGALFGTEGWFLIDAESSGGLPLYAFWMFQTAFCGAAALIGTIILRPRTGKFNEDGSPNFIAGDNIPLVPLGVFLLWFGWFGFNPGSALGMNDPELVARVTVNTNLAAAAGVITAMITAWAKFGKPDLALTMNGALAGLVAITAPCAVVSPGAAVYIGAIAGILCIYGVRWLDRLRVDDPVGAVPVHCLNGIWGTLAVGLFAQIAFGAPRNGLFYGIL